MSQKWKRSDSSDSDSVAFKTPLTTPMFEFHWVISALTTPTTTLSLVKTSLQKTAISRRHHWFPSEEIKAKNEKRVQKFHTDDASLPS